MFHVKHSKINLINRNMQQILNLYDEFYANFIIYTLKNAKISLKIDFFINVRAIFGYLARLL